MRGVDENRTYIPPRLPDQFDILADQSLNHVAHVRNRTIQIDRLRPHRLFAGECQQLPCDIRGLTASLVHLNQVGMQRIRTINLLQCKVCIPEDHREHIVVVVCDPPSQLSDGFHLLSLTIALFDLTLLSDVMDDAMQTGLAGKIDGTAEHFDVSAGSIGQAVIEFQA